MYILSITAILTVLNPWKWCKLNNKTYGSAQNFKLTISTSNVESPYDICPVRDKIYLTDYSNRKMSFYRYIFILDII